MYDVIELNTNVKPFAIKYLLSKYDAVVYLDPDVKVYTSLDSVFEALNHASILVTPHYITPILDGDKPDDLELLKFGAFNLGFVAVSNSSEGLDFLSWWSERCLKHGFYEPQIGLAVDQKWVGLAPCYFPNLKILYDVGLNVAFWNLHERTISKIDDKWFINEVTPLKFIHFSSFDATNPSNIANKQSRFKAGSRPDFIELANEYAQDQNKMSLNNKHSSQQYGFDFFEDGVYITPALRRFYAALFQKKFAEDENPFLVTSKVRLFAKSNGLLNKNGTPSRRHTFKDLNKYSFQITFINKTLRLVLYLIGPDRYFNLMRYIAHISSIRNQSEIFGEKK